MIKIKMLSESKDKIKLRGIPLGVQYYGPPHSRKEDWQADFPLIKAHGLDIIVAWAIWGRLEPRPDTYQFSEWDRLFDIANEHGLSVMPNTVIEIQPYWIHRKFPDDSMVDQRGNLIVSTTGEYTGGISPGVCFDYEETREQASRFLTNFASHFKDRENLFGWDAWCELRWLDNVNDMAMNTSFRTTCYCKQTIAKYRNWLDRKYGSLEGLESRWRHKHTDWADVNPPRGGLWSYGFPEMVDWREFIIANMVEKLQMRVDALRRGDPGHPVMNHTGSASVLNLSGYSCRNGTDDWQNAEVVDMYGTSFYPVRKISSDSPELLCMWLDGVRSAARASEKPFWISELQGGPALHSPGKGINYPPQDLKFWSYCTLAYGAKGVLYWSWRPEPLGPQALGFGLTTYGGVPTPRTRIVQEVANTIRTHEALLGDAKDYPAQVAILFDPDVYTMNHFGGTGGMEPGMAVDSVHGYYKALWENDIPCDFVHAADMGNLEKYKLLILPFAFCLRENVAGAIKTFVTGGGTVVGEAYLGRYSEGCVPATTCPAYGLHELFKVRATEVEFIDSAIIVPVGKQELFTGVDALTGYWYKELPLLLEGAEVLASFTDGTPAVTRSHAGSGRTILFGALMGLGYSKATNDKSLAKLIGKIAVLSGVVQSARMTGAESGLARVRVLRSGKSHLVFCSNYGKKCTAKLELNVDTPSEITDLETNELIEYSLTDKTIELDLSMEEKEARILLLKER